jgi:hypothetical protein
MTSIVAMGPIKDMWTKWRMLKLPWRKTFLRGKTAHTFIRQMKLSSKLLQARTFKAILFGNSRTNSTPTASVESYGTTTKLISQTSRSLRNGTSG